MVKSLRPLVQASFFLLLWMSWLRIVLYLYLIYPHHGVPGELGIALFTGLRFDLLVLGFAWIPVWILYWLSYFLGRLSQISGIFKFYFCFNILLILVFSIFDFYWFHTHSVRMNYLALSQEGAWAIGDNIGDLGLVSALPLMFIPGFVLFAWVLIKLSIKDFSEKSSLIAINLVISLIIVASAARGTWTAHHLELAHSLISDNKLVNQLVLNPLWNFDKM